MSLFAAFHSRLRKHGTEADLEALLRHFRRALGRDLTPREQRWLSLSALLLPLPLEDFPPKPVLNSLKKTA